MLLTRASVQQYVAAAFGGALVECAKVAFEHLEQGVDCLALLDRGKTWAGRRGQVQRAAIQRLETGHAD